MNTYSSNKKVSQFETPKATLSQVKLKHGSGKNDGAKISSIGAGTNEDSKSEVRRRLVMKNLTHSSIAAADSREIAGRLSTIKNYLEDADNNSGLIGMMLNNSS